MSCLPWRPERLEFEQPDAKAAQDSQRTREIQNAKFYLAQAHMDFISYLFQGFLRVGSCVLSPLHFWWLFCACLLFFLLWFCLLDCVPFSLCLERVFVHHPLLLVSSMVGLKAYCKIVQIARNLVHHVRGFLPHHLHEYSVRMHSNTQTSLQIQPSVRILLMFS